MASPVLDGGNVPNLPEFAAAVLVLLGFQLAHVPKKCCRTFVNVGLLFKNFTVEREQVH